MRFAKIPLEAARWFLLLNIVVAVWLYGGTRDWTREYVTWLLLANAAIFLLGTALQRRLPGVPLAASLAVLFLLAQSGFMVWNAKRHWIDGFDVFVERLQPLPGWPGFWDVAMVMPALLLTVGLLGAFCIACDMASTPAWRDRLLITMAATGLSIVILGLAQRLTEADDIFWGLETRRGATFFAVFRYHANAGAFINLVLPLQVALGVRALRQEGAEAGRVFWLFAAFVTAAGGFVNVSKAANAICFFLIVAMAFWFGANGSRVGGARMCVVVVFAVLAVVGVAVSFGLEKSVNRWEDLFRVVNSGERDSRLQAYEIIFKGALPEAGWWGSGPGTFERMFDIQRAKLGSALEGRWDKAHSDPLQTLMEWGRAGALALLVLLAGGLWKSIMGLRRKTPDAILAAGIAFALGGVMVHALVDFPLQIASLQLFTVVLAGLGWGSSIRPYVGLRGSRA